MENIEPCDKIICFNCAGQSRMLSPSYLYNSRVRLEACPVCKGAGVVDWLTESVMKPTEGSFEQFQKERRKFKKIYTFLSNEP